LCVALAPNHFFRSGISQYLHRAPEHHALKSFGIAKIDASLRVGLVLSHTYGEGVGREVEGFDTLTPVLEEIAQADGLVLGSPIYFGDVTGQMRTFLERLAFPWLSYNDYSMTAPKRMPVVLIETMNGTPERNNSNGYGSMEHCLSAALGQPERIVAYNTYQVKNYDRFELASFSEEAKRRWRDEHWAEDLQKAFDAGKKMAERILG